MTTILSVLFVMFGMTISAQAQIACVDAVLDETLLNENEAVSLCCGSSSLVPLNCYEQGEEETLLNSSEIVELCRCAVDLQPLRCYLRGEDETGMASYEILNLCERSVERRTPPRPPGALTY